MHAVVGGEVEGQRVQVLIRESRLKAQRVGRSWVVRASDVAAFAPLPREPGYPKGRPQKAKA